MKLFRIALAVTAAAIFAAGPAAAGALPGPAPLAGGGLLALLAGGGAGCLWLAARLVGKRFRNQQNAKHEQK